VLMRYSMYWRRFIMLIDYPLFTFSESPDIESHPLKSGWQAADILRLI